MDFAQYVVLEAASRNAFVRHVDEAAQDGIDAYGTLNIALLAKMVDAVVLGNDELQRPQPAPRRRRPRSARPWRPDANRIVAELRDHFAHIGVGRTLPVLGEIHATQKGTHLGTSQRGMAIERVEQESNADDVIGGVANNVVERALDRPRPVAFVEHHALPVERQARRIVELDRVVGAGIEKQSSRALADQVLAQRLVQRPADASRCWSLAK